MRKTQVVIIGGGVTGAGLLWDLSLRGIPAVLLEKKDLANGATGRCHGLLHSGGRYVIKDAEAVKECISENIILKQIAAPCVHDTGGLFVHIKGDDPGYVDSWVVGCKQIGIPTSELSRDEALALEPNLPPDIVKALTCPDAHIDVFQLTIANVEAAVAKGAQYKTYSEVTAIEVENQKACGVCLGGPTGYAMNPARDLSPRLAHFILPIAGKGQSDWGYALVPIFGPFVGAAIAAASIHLIKY